MLRFRLQGLELRVQGCVFRISGLRIRVSALSVSSYREVTDDLNLWTIFLDKFLRVYAWKGSWVGV